MSENVSAVGPSLRDMQVGDEVWYQELYSRVYRVFRVTRVTPTMIIVQMENMVGRNYEHRFRKSDGREVGGLLQVFPLTEGKAEEIRRDQKYREVKARMLHGIERLQSSFRTLDTAARAIPIQEFEEAAKALHKLADDMVAKK